MRRYLPFCVFFILFIFGGNMVFAQSALLPEQPLPQQEYFVKGSILKIVKNDYQEIDGYNSLIQTINIRILDGKEKNKVITVTRASDTRLASSQTVSIGSIVVLDVVYHPKEGTRYTITDEYRLHYLLFITLAFFIITLIFAGKKGLGAMIGLAISLSIIIGFIIPQILHHQNPLMISFLGSLAILFVTTYLAHGFSKQTSIAVLSTFLSLITAIAFAIFCVNLARLAGLGTEDSYLLELSPNQAIDPKGLLLGGILIGTLGALNDVTTTQVAAIFALHKQNTTSTLFDLAKQGFLIGREHIVSLVNTLVLAYTGASLTILIFFVLNPSHLPLWLILNNESVAEEIIRTIAGSIGLILAVPITTFLAAWIVTKKRKTSPV